LGFSYSYPGRRVEIEINIPLYPFVTQETMMLADAKIFRCIIIQNGHYLRMGWDTQEPDIDVISARIRDFLAVEFEVCRDCKQSAKGPCS